MSEKPEAPPELFPGVEWNEYDHYFAVNLNPRGDFIAVLFEESRPGVFTPELDCEEAESPMSEAEALDWLRKKVIEARDELCRVTGTVALPKPDPEDFDRSMRDAWEALEHIADTDLVPEPLKTEAGRSFVETKSAARGDEQR